MNINDIIKTAEAAKGSVGGTVTVCLYYGVEEVEVKACSMLDKIATLASGGVYPVENTSYLVRQKDLKEQELDNCFFSSLKRLINTDKATKIKTDPMLYGDDSFMEITLINPGFKLIAVGKKDKIANLLIESKVQITEAIAEKNIKSLKKY